ncbi:ATP-binding protein [Sphingobacterium sp. NPDC055431]
MPFVRVHIAVLFLILLHLMASGQELPALQSNLEQAKTKEEKFTALVKLSDYWSYRDTAKAFETLRQAQPLVEGKDYLRGIYLFYEAGIYYGYDNPKSQKLYMEAEKFLKDIDKPAAYGYRARLWHNYGSLEQQADNDKSFLDITLTYCIPLAIKSGDNDLLLSYFTDVGMVFYNNKEYQKALDYFEKAVSLVRTPEQESGNLLFTYLNMFDLFYAMGEIEKGDRVLGKAEKLLNKLEDKKLAAAYYKNKSRSLIQQKNYLEALKSIEKGLEWAQEYNSYWDFYYLKYEKVVVYNLIENYQAAKVELEELLRDPRGSAMTKNRLGLMSDLAEMEAKLGNMGAAYQIIRKHKQLSDSLGSLDFKKQMAELETRYRTKEKEQEIVLLENRNILNRAILLGGILLTSIFGLWVWYAWNARKKRNMKDTLLLKQQREIDVAKALVDGEEQERKRLARELHDGLLGRVTGLKMNVERIARDSEQNDLPTVVNELETVITDLRQTAQNLEPSVLKRNGLDEAIRHFCQSMQSGSSPISYYGQGLEGIKDKNIQLSIYRIVQELVTNAVRHAQATKILLQCSVENGFLMIEAEDNGKGFNPESIQRNMGLDNLESRLKSIGGTLKIDSQPGEGTHIIIECQL